MKKRFLEKGLLAITFALLLGCTVLSGPAYSGSMTAKPANRSIALLESTKQNYIANIRLEALKTNNPLPDTTGQPTSWLTRVDADRVNMAVNRLEDGVGQEVSISGKVYRVPDMVCAENMRLNPSTRFARDPFTDNLVDKSDAVIYADASGRVLYFESQDTYRDFIGQAPELTAYGYSAPE